MSTITKPSRKEREFVQAAPDAKSPPVRRRPPVTTTQINITVADDLLQRLDSMARETGQSRAGLIKIGISRLLRDGL
jgi:hypothetical protein